MLITYPALLLFNNSRRPHLRELVWLVPHRSFLERHGGTHLQPVHCRIRLRLEEHTMPSPPPCADGGCIHREIHSFSTTGRRYLFRVTLGCCRHRSSWYTGGHGFMLQIL